MKNSFTLVLLSSIFLHINCFGNDVTVRACVTGDKLLTYNTFKVELLESIFYTGEYLSTSVSLGNTSTTCKQFTRHYKKKHKNNIYLSRRIFGPYRIKIIKDTSCENVEKPGIEGNVYVDNGHGKKPINWEIEYDLKAEFGKPAQMSCIISYYD